ncbi:MAG: ABC transporter permease subunit [Anaerolineaceae bacterium]|nr:ABC transporter permease subunit [Anaerolineaceae bacterium]
MDSLIQRLTEVNLVLPILAICVMAYAFLNLSLWLIFFIIVILNVFGSPVKNFRSAFLNINNAPYIEGTQAYGASSLRIITKYMVPRIIPVLIPQLIILIPSYVFLEVTLGLFNISTGFPT